jgi:hypothetical protein
VPAARDERNLVAVLKQFRANHSADGTGPVHDYSHNHILPTTIRTLIVVGVTGPA